MSFHLVELLKMKKKSLKLDVHWTGDLACNCIASFELWSWILDGVILMCNFLLVFKLIWRRISSRISSRNMHFTNRMWEMLLKTIDLYLFWICWMYCTRLSTTLIIFAQFSSKKKIIFSPLNLQQQQFPAWIISHNKFIVYLALRTFFREANSMMTQTETGKKRGISKVLQLWAAFCHKIHPTKKLLEVVAADEKKLNPGYLDSLNT